MFSNCYNLIDVSNVKIDGNNSDGFSIYTRGMFKYCNKLNLSTFRPLNLFRYPSTSDMFRGCATINDSQLEDFIQNKVLSFTLGSGALAGTGISQPLNVKKFTKVSYNSNFGITSLYATCPNIVNVNLDDLAIMSTRNAQYLFSSCNNLSSVSANDYISVPNINGMFNNCTNLKEATIGIINSNVSELFRNCYNLKTVNILNNSIINNRHSLRYMFAECQNLETLNAPNWLWSGRLDNGSYVMCNGVNGLFYNCRSLKYNKPINMTIMNECMEYMFLNCYNITSDINLHYIANMDSAHNNAHMAFSGIGSSNITAELEARGSSGVYATYLASNCPNLKNISVTVNSNRAVLIATTYNMVYNAQKLETVYLNIPANVTSSLFANVSVCGCTINNSVTLDLGNCQPVSVNLAQTVTACNGEFDITVTNIHIKPNCYINMWGVVSNCPSVQNINIDLSNVTSNIGPLVIYNCPNISDTSMDNIIGQIANHTVWENSTSYYNIDGNSYVEKIFANCNISGDRLNNLPNTAKLVAKGWKVNI